MTDTQTVEGVIKKVTEYEGRKTGVTLEGHEGYYNYSQPDKRKQPWDEHKAGDTVKLAYAEWNDKRYISAIKRVSAGTNGVSPTSATAKDAVFNRKWALECSLSHYNAKGGAMSLEEVVLGAEFLLTFLEASEPAENPFGDGDPGPENPFE